MILFFLLTSDGPLLQFLLIPVQLQLDLLYLLIDLEDPHLDIVQSLLMFHYHLVVLLYLLL